MPLDDDKDQGTVKPPGEIDVDPHQNSDGTFGQSAGASNHS